MMAGQVSAGGNAASLGFADAGGLRVNLLAIF